jgi:hypothetical protein
VPEDPEYDSFNVRARPAKQRMHERDGLRLDSLDAHDVDFSGPKAKVDLHVFESDFTRCRFERMDLAEACFGGGTRQSVYTDCSFDGTRLRSRSVGNARFVACSFRDVRIEYMLANCAEFVDCVFTGTLKDAVFWGSIAGDAQRDLYGRVRNQVEGNDYSNACLVDCGFRGGVDLSLNRLPEGDGFLVALDGRDALARAKTRVFEMPDSHSRQAALNLIRAQEIMNGQGAGQEHLWMRRDDMRSVSGGAMAMAHQLVFDTVREESHSLLK